MLNPKTDEQDSVTCGFAPMQALGTSFRTPLKFESRPWGDVKKAYTHFKNGDVLMAKVTPCFENGKAGIAANLPNGIGAGSSEFFVIRPSTGIDARYLLGWLSTEAFRKRAALAMTGSVGLKRVPKDLLQTEVIPVAPAAEQKRIADKLDTVLTRVDAVNTRLARVAPLLKRFRQSVLAAATSGRLTEDWRKTRTGASALEYQSIELTIPYAHAVTAPKTWTAMRFDQAIDLVGGSQPPKAVFSDVELDGYVRLIQIRDYKSDKYKTHIPRELARRFCSSSDVMIGRYGPPIFQILRGLEGAYNVALMKAVPRQDIYSNDYLFYFLQKPDLLRYVEAGSDRTAGQDGVNKDHLIKYPVFAPPIEEQTEIVRRVETLFAFADRLEVRLAQAQTAATRLTPALLAKAFRGELVPQDPNDEPAADLLRRLAQAPAAASPRKGRRAASAAV
nr:restriction endonuclease subunit S [uncultured Rhodoferax sp.]